MKFNLKSKTSLLSDVNDALGYTKIPFETIDEHTLQVDVDDERSEEFLFLLSFSMAYFAFRKMVLEELVRLQVDKDLNLELYKEASLYFQSRHYWTAMTTVWVDDHFSSKSEINMDTFPLFNMKGFKQEVKNYTKRIVDESNGESFGSEPQIQYGEAGELASVIKERLVEKELDLTDYKTLHLYESDDGFDITDSKGNDMTDDFFMEHAQMLFHINGTNTEDETNHYQKMILLYFLLTTLESETLHVHQLYDEFSQSCFDEGRVSFSPLVNIIECEGCPSCE